MKHYNLKISNPCSENWDTMSLAEKGRFCEKCAKNVMDFTQLDPFQISEVLRKSKGQVCGRVTPNQMHIPILETRTHWHFNFPRYTLAAGFVLASTITLASGIPAAKQKPQTEFAPNFNASNEVLKSSSIAVEKNGVQENLVLNGMVQDAYNKGPIEHAKITLFTVSRIYTTYSSKEGLFSLEIPADMVNETNVFRVSYGEIVDNRSKADSSSGDVIHLIGHFPYESQDYTFTKASLDTVFLVQAEQMTFMMGAFAIYRNENNPVVFLDGEEIRWEYFEDMRDENKSKDFFANRTQYYLEPQYAKALYGEAGQYGMYLIYSNEPKK